MKKINYLTFFFNNIKITFASNKIVCLMYANDLQKKIC